MITKRGRPVAQLVRPSTTLDTHDPLDALRGSATPAATGRRVALAEVHSPHQPAGEIVQSLGIGRDERLKERIDGES